jgi:hypothetical protein
MFQVNDELKNHFYWLYIFNNIWPLAKGYQSKTLVKSTTLQLVKKTIPIVMNLFKLTWFRKLGGFFDTYHFGVFFYQKT